jgi:hypothetical protein
MREGLGKMNSETPKPRVTASQMATMTSNNSKGDQRSMDLRDMVMTVVTG